MQSHLLRFGLILLSLAALRPAYAGTGQTTATVTMRPLQQQLSLFARVIPQRRYQVTSSLGGRLRGFSLKVGDPVHQGEVIAHLGGPSLTAQIQSSQQAVKQGKVELASAQSILKLTRQKRRQKLATQQDLLKTQTALSRAQTQLAVARSRLQDLQNETQLTAPTDGKVTRVSAANGDYLSAGQSLLRILPDRGLWLQARAYGQEGQRLKVGQSGQFRPDSGTAVAVRVATLVPDADASGTWELYLTPTKGPPNWFAGEAGTLNLTGGTQSLPAVPSAALVMDQGKWWVMEKTGQGSKPIQVEPAARRNGWTWLAQGVRAGQQVLVQGAYQAFHRNFSKQYANPD